MRQSRGEVNGATFKIADVPEVVGRTVSKRTNRGSINLREFKRYETRSKKENIMIRVEEIETCTLELESKDVRVVIHRLSNLTRVLQDASPVSIEEEAV